MADQYRLVLDVGGSYIKYAVADKNGQFLSGSMGQTPAYAEEGPDAIFAVISSIIHTSEEQARLSDACVSIPGPFDYENGISLMKHKFSKLYNQHLTTPFDQAGLPVRFVHDSTAFMLGEYYDGTLRGAKHPCCVMLGTGLGFAMMRDGRVCVDETQTPALALWCSPYLDGRAEDYVSTKAIRGRYDGCTDVKEIAELARVGDKHAKSAFAETAHHLSAILTPLLTRLDCDRFTLGGQIAKSADLLPLALPVPWHVSTRLDDAALRGADWYGRKGKDACVQVIPKMMY